MSVTVEELKKWLEQFPDNARVHAYEGEDTGIAVVGEDGEEIGFLRAHPMD